MKKVAMSLLGVAFAFTAVNASADLIEYGDVTGVAEGFSFNGFNQTLPVGSFGDDFTFTLTQEASVSITVETAFNENLGFVFSNINNLATSLIGPGPNDTMTFPTVDVPDDGSFSNSGTLTLGAGDYTYQVSGFAAGVDGGDYTNLISVITDPTLVPEIPIPAAGLLFFSGIAALGLVRSRRASA